MALIDRVKYDGPANVLVWRYPPDDLSFGTQVIVNQSQEAVLFKGGQALDVLGPGTHTLETANIPLLRGFIKMPFGGQTPFAAEIYYVNKTTNLDVKWGTNNPIPILDPKFNVFLPVRAFGQFGVQVADSKLFVVQIAGTLGEFTVETLTNYFRGLCSCAPRITSPRPSLSRRSISSRYRRTWRRCPTASARSLRVISPSSACVWSTST